MIMGMESTSNRMSGLGRSQLLHGKTLTEDEIVQRIDSVTVDTLYSLADMVFQMDKVSMAVVGNFGDMDFESMLSKVK
jgi:predicted Zn-dependent peptidase